MVSTCGLGGHYLKAARRSSADDFAGRLHVFRLYPHVTGATRRRFHFSEQENIAESWFSTSLLTRPSFAFARTDS